jgi:hypothetical protein
MLSHGPVRTPSTVLLLLVLLLAGPAVADDDERRPAASWTAGLMQLFDALGGPAWMVQTGWGGAADSTDSPCTWHGVQCAPPTDGGGGAPLSSVFTGLVLPHNNLVGVIPAAFFARAVGGSLRVLNLSGNAIRGTLPADLFDALPSLRLLDVSRNLLSGVIPASLGRAASLEQLVMRQNQLRGPCPEVSAINAGQLQVLDLGMNRLTGAFPRSYAAVSRALHTLLLDDNFIADATGAVFAGNGGGPSPWRQTLRRLDVSNNYLIGPLPSDIGAFAALRVLRLDGNRIHGTLPRALANLSRLEELRLSHNYLRGSIPCAPADEAAVGTGTGGGQGWWFGGPGRTPFPALHFLDLSDNDLEGAVCDVAPASPLQTLRLADNSLSGAAPRVAGQQLVEVTLGGANKWHCDLPRVEDVPGWVDVPPSTACVDSSVFERYPLHQPLASGEDVFLFSMVLLAFVSLPFAVALLEASGVLVLSATYRAVLASGVVHWAGRHLEYEESEASDGDDDDRPAGTGAMRHAPAAAGTSE